MIQAFYLHPVAWLLLEYHPFIANGITLQINSYLRIQIEDFYLASK